MKAKNSENGGGAYPYSPLQLCLPVAAAVSVLGGGKAVVSKSLLASHLKEDEKSASLAFKLTSTKCFGMIEGRSAFVLTDVAKRYFFPTIEHDSKQALLEFLATPPAFRAVIQRFDGARLPSAEMLGNILHKEAGVPVSWKDRVAGFFIRSAQHVGIIDTGGHLRFKSAQHGAVANSGGSHESDDMHNLSEKANSPSSSVFAPLETTGVTARSPSNVWTFSEQGKMVRVETPSELSVELWKKLEAYIKLLQPAEVKS